MKKIFAVLIALAMLLCSVAMAEDYAIATDNDFRPFEYLDEEGNLVGIDIEILAGLRKIRAFPTRWNLSAGKGPSMRANPDRRTE